MVARVRNAPSICGIKLTNAVGKPSNALQGGVGDQRGEMSSQYVAIAPLSLCSLRGAAFRTRPCRWFLGSFQNRSWSGFILINFEPGGPLDDLRPAAFYLA